MLGTGLGYLLAHPVRAIKALATDPVEAWTSLYDAYVDRRERRGPQCQYESEEDWEYRLHRLLGVPWPCESISEFWTLWGEVIAALKAKGIRAGPESFGRWNDADAGLARGIWCLVRHLQPTNVVETGVAHGVTSRIVLEALERNGAGHLWSIDLPSPNPTLQKQVGMAVDGRIPHRWSYIKGSSRRHLPQLLSQLGHIDLFIHDSLHSERNVSFELNQAWAALRTGGVIVVDDVDANWGFHYFTQTFSDHQSMVCEAEPGR